MSEQQTCGTGLAARSSLPAKLAEVTAAMAEILAFHQKSLDRADAIERPVYERLEEQYRAIATSLQAVATAMAGARNLPPARHDVSVLANRENAGIFAKFVKLEQELIALLQKSIEQDSAMLEQMRATR